MEHYAAMFRLITPVLLTLGLFIMSNINTNLNSLNENIFNHESRLSKVETEILNFYRGQKK